MLKHLLHFQARGWKMGPCGAAVPPTSPSPAAPARRRECTRGYHTSCAGCTGPRSPSSCGSRTPPPRLGRRQGPREDRAAREGSRGGDPRETRLAGISGIWSQPDGCQHPVSQPEMPGRGRRDGEGTATELEWRPDVPSSYCPKSEAEPGEGEAVPGNSPTRAMMNAKTCSSPCRTLVVRLASFLKTR